MTPQDTYITVDPGINEAGWVSWYKDEVTGAGIIKTSCREWPWHMRALEVCQGLNAVVVSKSAYSVFCEMPTVMLSSGRGRAAAKDVVHLAYMVGMLSVSVDTRIDWELVEVNDWKGNMDKKAVEARVRRILGEKVIEEFEIKKHMFDASGIGLKLQGRFK